MTESEEDKTYRYTELSKKARDRAIREVRDHKYEWLWDSIDADQLTEDFKDILYNTHGLGESGGYPFEVYWSLGYCQGDGVCFTGQVDVEKFIKTQKLRDYEKLIPFLGVVINVPNPRYCHANGMTVEVSFEGEKDGLDLVPREQRKEINDWYWDTTERVKEWNRIVDMRRRAIAYPYEAHRVRLEEWEARRGKGVKSWIPEPMPVYDPANLPPVPPEPPEPSQEPPKRLARIMARAKAEWKELEELSFEFEAYMKDKVVEISRELESRGYTDIEFRSGDEFIDQELKENPTFMALEFYEDGKLVDR